MTESYTCKNGHEVSGTNIVLNKTTGHKQCRICRRACQNRAREKDKIREQQEMEKLKRL